MAKAKTVSKFFPKKQCVTCEVVGGWFRPFVNAEGRTYFQRTCNDCNAIYQQKWRQGRTRRQLKTHNLYMRGYRKGYRKRFPERTYGTKEWNNANPELSLWRSLQVRVGGYSKQKTRKVLMTRSEFLEEIGKIPKLCPVLGIPMRVGSGAFSDNSATVDRIDGSKPYQKGNIAVISWRANAIKRDGTAEEHRKIAAWMDAMAARAMPPLSPEAASPDPAPADPPV